MRVLPAEFARMVGVSKQSVSQWIKQGKVMLGPDGRLDPHKASREVLQRTDPARLRARVFKDAMSGTDQLRARVRDLEQQLAGERKASEERAERIAYATRNSFMDTQVERLCVLEDAIANDLAWLTAALAAGSFSERFDALITPIFYPEIGALADAADAEDNSTDDAATVPQEQHL
jgi:DNA-binding transcriptional regulator YdaS (Cro superfamily)